MNVESNNFISKNLQISISQILVPLTTFSFILLSSYLIDIKNNFPKWRKAFLITYTISAILLAAACFILLVLVENKLDPLYEIIPKIISPYYIITNGLIGISFFIGTLILVFRRHPQAIYLLLCQILMIPGGFIRYVLEEFFDKSFNYEDYFLTNELIILINLGLLIIQALLLNFSIIRKMKFLQMEVIAIGDKNRQILAEQNQTLEVKVKERTHELHLESQKSERLMLNILPESIASRLKAGDDSISDSYQNATVLFSDLVGFTKMSSSKTAEELVFLLNDLFKRFDTRATSLGLEKIKTIGDAYMVAGGLPTQDDTHAIQVTKMALGMYEDLDAFNKEHGMELGMRIGINSGPVVAGVIGHSKFSYDLWGNTVNTASRMESTCLPGKVQVSPSTYAQIKGHFEIQENQVIECKGLGQIMTYFVK
jgi:class 3 adenylate cyclase